MKLIGAALPRTGTMSLYTALNQLGMPCYHMKTLFENSAKGRNDLEWWIQVGKLPQGHPQRLELLERIFEGYEACCDAPACFVYQDLMLLYPDAKVMITKRDAGRWRSSVAEIVYGILRLSRAPGASFFGPANQLLYRLPVVGLLGLPGAIIPMTTQWGEPLATGGEWFHFESEDEAERIEASFTKWLKETEDAVPPERRIILESPYQDAYRKVCGALDLPVPTRPWPHVNDKAQTKTAISIFTALFYLFPLMSLIGILCLAGALFFSSQAMLTMVVAAIAILGLICMRQVMQSLLDNAASKDKTLTQPD